MAKNFLEGPKLNAQGQRNGFDVSYQNQFTAPFGMMLPCFFQRVNPDDKIKISLESQTICDGLVKPAFMRLKEHWDYYFIPATQLWMPFDNFITGQSSYFSTAVSNVNGGETPSDVPTFHLSALGAYLKDNHANQLKDEQGFDFNEGAVRLLDLLGYFNLSGFVGGFPSTGDNAFTLFDNNEQRVNLFPLLCYQKVYYDFFRNDKYEDNDVKAYNIDDLSAGYEITDMGDVGSRFNKFLAVHYRWQKKDYFTQVQPNVLVSNRDSGYQNMDDIIDISNLFNVPGIAATGNSNATIIHKMPPAVTSPNDGVSVSPSRYPSANNAEFAWRTSVSSIRFAFAYDRLLRRMRQAGPDFDSQMLAQFGVKPFDPRHGKCYYLGGYTNNLSSKDVTNVTGESIGDLAGQINSYSDNTGRWLKYHAKEHGYIIGIYSTSVDNMYQSYRSSRETLIRNRFDWFNPAFENLGLQPLFEMEYDYTFSAGTLKERSKSFNPNSRTGIIGYVPRYSELKTRVDECHGLLCQYNDIVGMREWNVQVNRQPNSLQSLNKANMQLNPHQFDAVSGVSYNGTQFTDHFVVNAFTHSHKVSTMSLYEEF